MLIYGTIAILHFTSNASLSVFQRGWRGCPSIDHVHNLQGRPPIPPCILDVNGKVQIAIELEDAADRPAVVKVTADSVLVRVTVNVTSSKLTEEVLALMAKVTST